ncbi:hypothetical protein H0X10_04145 [Candidatus Saccharibacteria bacterium]|nr:hypothetical protein [Candidatus Saccharibacteria bacterium]
MRYIFAVFGVLIIMIFAVILIVRRNPAPVPASQTGKKQVVLGEYENKPVTAQYIRRGEITADEERNAIRVSVSNQERVIEILQGYNETVTKRQTYANNAKAFAIFLSALDSAGFAREKETTITDERGICPTGNRFVYKLQDGTEQILRFWATSCSTKQGSFGGNSVLVRSLFEKQIPDYSTVVRDVKL